MIIHSPVEALERERDNLRRASNSHLRPRLLLSPPSPCPHLLYCKIKNTTIWQRLTAMKLSDIDLDLDAVDLVRLTFLAAAAGVSMHPYTCPRLSPG